ncbi:MAG: hypothetical protein NXI32_20165 [bacterium]|nr:hypothetical protein [bacterium]
MNIPDVGIADPYPSSIEVDGITSPLTNVTVTLRNFSHTYPDDTAAVVVSPRNTAVLLFSGPGAGIDAVDLTWVFDDRAEAGLPLFGALSSGTFRPGTEQWDDFFPAPGPGGKIRDEDPAPWEFRFAPLLSEDPNGQWNLFVLDSLEGDGGQIEGGWSISFEVVPEPSCGFLLTAAMLFPHYMRRRKKESGKL